MTYGWRSDSSGYGGDNSSLHRLPAILPPVDTAAWENLLHGIRRHFIYETARLRPPVSAGRLFFCHPSQEAMIDTLRGIHNGDIDPPCDGEGNQGELPRVWRREHQLRIFWVIELPPSWTRRQFELQFAA